MAQKRNAAEHPLFGDAPRILENVTDALSQRLVVCHLHLLAMSAAIASGPLDQVAVGSATSNHGDAALH
jgi:hypothetical protein